MSRKIACVECGEELMSKRRRQVYCSYPCKREFWRRVRHAGLKALGIKSA